MLAQKFPVAALVLAALGGIPAFASLTTYSSLSSFQSATSGDTFSNITFAQGSLGTSTSDLGVTFSTNGSGLNGDPSPTGWPTGATEPALVSNSGVNTLTITLPASVNALDFYVGPQDFSYFTITVTDNAGGNFSSGAFEQTVSVQDPLFFGVVSTGSITSITITGQASNDQMTIDDMQISQASAPTPEVATLLLVGTGLLLTGHVGRRRRRMLRPATT